MAPPRRSKQIKNRVQKPKSGSDSEEVDGSQKGNSSHVSNHQTKKYSESGVVSNSSQYSFSGLNYEDSSFSEASVPLDSSQIIRKKNLFMESEQESDDDLSINHIDQDSQPHNRNENPELKTHYQPQPNDQKQQSHHSQQQQSQQPNKPDNNTISPQQFDKLQCYCKRIQTNEYRIRRMNKYTESEGFDIGIAFLHQLVVYCYEEGFITHDMWLNIKYLTAQNSLNFIRKFLSRKLEQSDFKETFFTPFHHRYLAELLMRQGKQRKYTLTSKDILTIPIELMNFYHYIWKELSYVEYEELCKDFAYKYELKEWEFVGVDCLSRVEKYQEQEKQRIEREKAFMSKKKRVISLANIKKKGEEEEELDDNEGEQKKGESGVGKRRGGDEEEEDEDQEDEEEEESEQEEDDMSDSNETYGKKKRTIFARKKRDKFGSEISNSAFASDIFGGGSDISLSMPKGKDDSLMESSNLLSDFKRNEKGKRQTVNLRKQTKQQKITKKGNNSSRVNTIGTRSSRRKTKQSQMEEREKEGYQNDQEGDQSGDQKEGDQGQKESEDQQRVSASEHNQHEKPEPCAEEDIAHIINNIFEDNGKINDHQDEKSPHVQDRLQISDNDRKDNEGIEKEVQQQVKSHKSKKNQSKNKTQSNHSQMNKSAKNLKTTKNHNTKSKPENSTEKQEISQIEESNNNNSKVISAAEPSSQIDPTITDKNSQLQLLAIDKEIAMEIEVKDQKRPSENPKKSVKQKQSKKQKSKKKTKTHESNKQHTLNTSSQQQEHCNNNQSKPVSQHEQQLHANLQEPQQQQVEQQLFKGIVQSLKKIKDKGNDNLLKDDTSKALPKVSEPKPDKSEQSDNNDQAQLPLTKKQRKKEKNKEKKGGKTKK